MTLEEARRQIDAVDLRLRESLMERMGLSRAVAETKLSSGNLTVYRPEREREILDSLGRGLTEKEKRAYLPVVRKIMERSRALQYGVIYAAGTAPEEKLSGIPALPEGCGRIRLRLARPDGPLAAADIVAQAGDAGCALEEMRAVNRDGDEVTFEAVFRCGPDRDLVRQMILQLAMESRSFEIAEMSAG